MAARFFLKACNSIVNLVIILALLISGAYAVYALWDNNQVLTAAEDVQADMIKLKPKVEEGQVADTGPTFDELLAINEGGVSLKLAVIRQLCLNIPILFLMNALVGMMGIEFTKEQLLGMNAQLNKIKIPE